MVELQKYLEAAQLSEISMLKSMGNLAGEEVKNLRDPQGVLFPTVHLFNSAGERGEIYECMKVHQRAVETLQSAINTVKSAYEARLNDPIRSKILMDDANSNIVSATTTSENADKKFFALYHTNMENYLEQFRKTNSGAVSNTLHWIDQHEGEIMLTLSAVSLLAGPEAPAAEQGVYRLGRFSVKAAMRVYMAYAGMRSAAEAFEEYRTEGLTVGVMINSAMAASVAAGAVSTLPGLSSLTKMRAEKTAAVLGLLPVGAMLKSEYSFLQETKLMGGVGTTPAMQREALINLGMLSVMGVEGWRSVREGRAREAMSKAKKRR